MALELIGGSILSALIEVLVDRLASREVLGFFKSHKLDYGLLEKLNETLNTVNGLLDDAEEKQITKHAVKNWLNDVKHAVYEAEDILEEINYEYLRSKDIDAPRPDSNWVIRYLVPNRRMKEMGAELQRILEKLERLLKHKCDLRHIEGTGGWRPLSEKTTPVVDETHVYGREADKEAIMEHLLTQHNDRRVCAVPIVGMGGIGKTTLAQLIYNDDRVKQCFELKAWVWASQQFDVARIIKDILEKINASTCRSKEPDESLMEALKGKKLLLVLDDAWNIKYNEWYKLLLPLQYVEQGSKIVVTTRDEDVATVTGTVIPSHHLNVISEEDCWKLFARDAFSGVNSGAVSHLEAYGREIVRKCEGLPLAAKTLGGLLHSVGDVKQWEKISNSSMWGSSNENIPPALTLSYYYLPSHLKRCFAYCAIFRKGYEFRKDEVITSWMAQGFLVQPRGVEEMEEIGEKYFDDLVSRSLFQQSTSDSFFSMHDLISDLAEYASGEFCFKLGINESGSGLEGEHSCSLPERTRYLSITSEVEYGRQLRVFRSIHGVQHLRALFPLNFFEEADSEALIDILPNLKRLRMLFLCQPKDISSQLLTSIGNLKHLRYLDLSDTAIERLPESVCTLYYLQSLLLSKCRHLMELPSYISNLKHLRHLDLRGTPIERLPDSVCTLYYLQSLLLGECRHLMELPSNISNLVNLQHLDIEGTNLKQMPPKMGKLTKLQTMQYYIVGKESGSSVKQLCKLSHIRKKLSIRNLRDVANAQDASDADLKGKKKIEELGLKWDGNTDDTLHEREVLERLEPSENVKQLVITGYGGTTFPGWLGKSSFSNMVKLTLSGCKNCILLPPVGQLPSLEELHIEGFDDVVAVSSEFYGIDPWIEKPFKSLERLKFEGMRNWQEWNTDVAGAFPHLADLRIRHCPKLTNGLPSHLPCLLSLYIQECPQLVVSIPEAPMLDVINVSEGDKRRISGVSDLKCLQFRRDPQLKGMEQMSHLDPSSFTHIKVKECSSFKRCQLDLLPQVSTLAIQRCLNLESLCIGERPLPALCHLTISHCPNLVSFPKGGLAAPDLTSLVLEGCLYLKSLPENMRSLLPSLQDLQLISLPEVDSFPEGGLPFKLNTLYIVDCIKLKVCGLQALPSLSCFRLTGNDVESFEEETLPSTLTTLEINRLENLKSLDYMGLYHLTSLQRLCILGCPKLESISELALPSSLQYLYLRNLESLDYMGLHHLTSLTTLEIKRLGNLKSLDYKGLHHLTSLRRLSIEGCHKLESISEQVLPSSLGYLDLRNLESLDYMGLHHLTSLQVLDIEGCPKLESISELALPSSLGYLHLRNLESLDYKGLHHLTSLDTLKIDSCPKLEIISEQVLPSSLEYQGLHHLTSLRYLSIESYPKLEHIPEQALPPSLEWLYLCKLESLDYIGLHHLTSLHNLKIGSCPKLESLQGLPSSLEFLQLWNQQDRDYKELRQLTSLRKMKIRRSLKLESFQEGTLPSSLEDLEIWDLEDLEYKGFRHLTSLRELHICSSPKLESVPGEKLPSSLVSLQLSAMINLKSVIGLQHLNSLCRLIISDCSQLESVPGEKLPSSLLSLQILSLINLKSVSELQHLTSLDELIIWDCPELDELEDLQIEWLSHHSDIRRCPKLNYVNRKRELLQ
ncbi:putative disease resistance RPP13-like protein 1 [Populus alba]|uniref:putative disease resistance RPP13-like protein 1 n=1 Tax=Populus alba TaxID=43335 RepID=UPI00158C7E97|nr:putative disease resistance RPP13-like protein 1 [Populus alba]